MKFPVQKTFFKIIAPIVLVNWVFGIGVVEYPIGKPRRIISGLWSSVNLFVYLGFLKMTKFAKTVNFHGSKIAAESHRVNTYLCAIFIAISLCLAQMRSKMVTDIFSKFSRMNNRMNILGIPNDYESIFRIQIIHLTIGFAWMFILLALGWNYVDLDFPSKLSRIGFFASAHYFLAFLFSVDLIFTIILRYCGNRFQRLNALLEELGSPEESGSFSFQELDNLFIYFSPDTREIHRNNSISIRTADQRWLLYAIGEARKIHRGLCRMAVELNRAFGVQLLLTMALSFGLIIALLYSSYISAEGSPSDRFSLTKWQQEILILLMLTSHTMKVFLTIDACNTASSQANRTGEIIGRLLDIAASDEDIRDEIKMFSLQLIQNPLNFTACGFFTLNYPLLRTMIGSVTTYFVIMLQMRNIYEPKEVDSLFNTTIPMQTHDSV